MKSALTAANAKRDADAALARESADREAARRRPWLPRTSRARMPRRRARKAHDALTERWPPPAAAEADARRLAGEVASARDELKLVCGERARRVPAGAVAAGEGRARVARAGTRAAGARGGGGARRALSRRGGCAATAEAAARRQREVAAQESRLRLEAEAAGFRAARERNAMTQSVRAAEERRARRRWPIARARRRRLARRVSCGRPAPP